MLLTAYSEAKAVPASSPCCASDRRRSSFIAWATMLIKPRSAALNV